MKKSYLVAISLMLPFIALKDVSADTTITTTPVHTNVKDTVINIDNTALGAEQVITSSTFTAGNEEINNSANNGILNIVGSPTHNIVFNGNNELSALTQTNQTSENAKVLYSEIPSSCRASLKCTETVTTSGGTSNTRPTIVYEQIGATSEYYVREYTYVSNDDTTGTWEYEKQSDAVGGYITADGNFNFTGLANEYTTTLTANATNDNGVPYAIQISGDSLAVSQAALNLVGSTKITSTNISFPSLGTVSPSSINFSNGDVNGFLIDGSKISFIGSGSINNLSPTNLLTIRNNEVIVNSGAYGLISGPTLMSNSDITIQSNSSSNAGTLAFDNVTFSGGTSFNLGDYATLDLTGSATFNDAITFDKGFVNIHDAKVFLNASQTYAGADLDFAGTNTVYDPTYSTGGSTGYGFYINNANSNINVNSGTTTILGATYLQNGELAIANGGTLNLSYLDYTGGDLSIANGGTLTLMERAFIRQDAHISGTLALDGDSRVSLMDGKDLHFAYSTSKLNLSGTNNVIEGATSSLLDISGKATLNVEAGSTNTVAENISTKIDNANLVLGANSLLFLNNLTFGNNSVLDNKGTLKLKGDTKINQALEFSSGNIALYGTTYTANSDAVFTGANLYLDETNTIVNPLTMTANTAKIIAGSNTSGSGATTFKGSTVLAGNMYVQSGYTLNFEDTLKVDAPVFENTGTLNLKGNTTFNNATEFATGTVNLLTDGLILTFNDKDTPSTLISGSLNVDDSTTNSINTKILGPLELKSSGLISIGENDVLNMDHFIANGGSVNVGTGGLFNLTDTALVKSDTSITKATVNSEATMSILGGAEVDGDIDLLSGSKLNIAVDSNTLYGSITGALTNSSATGSSEVSLTVSPQFTGNSLKIAGSEAGNLILDTSNLFYKFGWQSGNIGTVNIERKTVPEIEATLRQKGSTVNQASTIAAMIIKASTGKVSTIADNIATDAQNGNLARANLNADALNPDMAPTIMLTASNINTQVMRAVGHRLNGVVRKRHSYRNRAVRASDYPQRYVRSSYQNQNRALQGQNAYGQYYRNADYYYAERARQAGSYNGSGIVSQTKPQRINSYAPSRGDTVSYQAYEDVYGNNSGDIRVGSTSLWVEGLYNKAKLKDDDVPGFDSKGWGVALGLEHDFSENFVAGIGYSYNSDEIKADLRNSDVASHTGFIYGSFMYENWFFDAVGTYTMSKYDETKYPYGIAIDSDFDVSSFGASVMAGYKMGSLAPELGLRYLKTSVDKYTDSVGQRIDHETGKLITAVLGLKGSHRILGRNSFDWRLAGTYDISRDEGSASVILPNGVVYNLQGRELDRFGFEVGLGLNFAITRSTSLALSYDGQFKSDYHNNVGMLQLKMKF